MTESMPRWRYVFADLLTDQTLAELPLTGVSFDRRIIVPGAFKASIPVPNTTVARQVQKAIPNSVHGLKSSGPGRTVLHVSRGREIWGSYIIWTADPQSDERGRVSIAIQGAGLESYLHHREIRDDQFFTANDQTSEIAATLILAMQGELVGNIGLLPNCPASGVLRDREYRRSEANTYGKRLEELANVDDGFEYLINVYADSNERVREFVTGYPQLGQADVPHTLEQPGDVISWRWLLDATSTATNWQTRGDSANSDVTEDSAPLMSGEFRADELLALGWPLLDGTRDYTSVIELPTLDAYARWWRDTRSGVVAIPEVTVRLPAQPSLTPQRLGDHARLRLHNVWWPDGFAARWRVVGMEVIPRQRGQAQDRAKLIFAASDEEV
ncbi:MAG: hypothetical protein ACRDT8_00270 [Micromonosporaceae bacterium]